MQTGLNPPTAARGRLWRAARTRVVGDKGWVRIAMVLPCVVLILAVTVFPLIYSLGLSFFRWEVQLPGRPFVGWANYNELIHDYNFWYSLKATGVIAGIAVTLEMCLGMAMALAMVGKTRGRSLFIPLLMLPLMMMPIAVGQTWRILLDPTYGPVDQILGFVLHQDISSVWLSDPSLVFPSIIVTDMWQWTPFVFLILLAGLNSINHEYYEAAEIDGAGFWQKFIHVTLPILRPIILLALLFRLLDAIKLFDIVYALTQGGPGTETETISYYLYQAGLQFFRYSYAAAGSYVLLVFVTIIAMILIRQIRET